LLKAVDPFDCSQLRSDLLGDAKDTGYVRFVLLCAGGWINQQQQHLHQLPAPGELSSACSDGKSRLRFNDDERRRLAAKAKLLGRKLLTEVATILTPETLLASSV
jgi:hypothetical protein